MIASETGWKFINSSRNSVRTTTVGFEGGKGGGEDTKTDDDNEERGDGRVC